MDEGQKRILPHSADAERAVLGAMLQQSDVFAAVAAKVVAGDFYMPAHKHIFAAMEQLHSSGKPVDEVTLVEHLEGRGLLNEAGGFTYLTDLQRAVPLIGNLPSYVRIIEEKATIRKLIGAASDIITDSYEGDEQAASLLATAEKRIFDISMKKMTGGLMPVANDVMESYLKLSEMGGQSDVTGLPTGFIDLDSKLSGLQRSDLIIVAARPAMGKTSFAINIAQHCAVNENAVVAAFSLEMSRDQLVRRMLCTQAKIDMQKIKTGQLSMQDWNNLAAAMPPLSSARFYIDDTAGISIAEMRSKLQRLKLEAGALDLVVIDYLQLMTYKGNAGNRQQEVSEMTRTLKIMARDLNVPIMLLSQLSRAPEQRADHKPIMSDLRESGSIEQDADIIIFLYRLAVYDPEAGNKSFAIISKHRNGPTGEVPLVWKGEYASFESFIDLAEPPF